MATRASDLDGRRPVTSSAVSRWRRLAVPALVGLALPLLAGCAQGFGAQTNQLYQPGPGLENRSSDVYVINAVIVTNGTGNGTLVAALMNQVHPGDRLVSTTATTSTGKALTVTGGSGTLLPTLMSVQLNDLASGGFGGIRLTGTLTAGTIATMTFTFLHAAPVTMDVPVVTQSDQFTSVDVATTPPTTSPSTPAGG